MKGIFDALLPLLLVGVMVLWYYGIMARIADNQNTTTPKYHKTIESTANNTFSQDHSIYNNYLSKRYISYTVYWFNYFFKRTVFSADKQINNKRFLIQKHKIA